MLSKYNKNGVFARLLAPLTDSILVHPYTLLYVRRSVGRLYFCGRYDYLRPPIFHLWPASVIYARGEDKGIKFNYTEEPYNEKLRALN